MYLLFIKPTKTKKTSKTGLKQMQTGVACLTISRTNPGTKTSDFPNFSLSGLCHYKAKLIMLLLPV